MWGVVFNFNKGERRIKPFETEEEALEFASKARVLKEKYPSLTIDVVSKLKAFPPDGDRKKPRGKNIYWCPYCREYRRFKFNDRWYRNCEICGISENEYYVRVYNKLF